jgi:hypothetical protein
MPNRELLEQYPLYRSMKAAIPAALNKVEKLPINMFCPVCKSNQTFVMQNDYFEAAPYENFRSEGQLVRCVYSCQHCHSFVRHFFVKIADDGSTLTKVGQFPAWDIVGEKAIQDRLGAHASYYKRGLICESQGYGIGAFAYYRRIVEETIDQLLNEVSDLLSEGEKTKYQEALAQTKQTRQTSEKIDLVKDLLPEILRPAGFNPLAALHEALSEGLHAESDEECLEYAVQVRNILAFLVQQIATTAEARKKFTANMRALLEKKSAKKTK